MPIAKRQPLDPGNGGRVVSLAEVVPLLPRRLLEVVGDALASDDGQHLDVDAAASSAGILCCCCYWARGRRRRLRRAPGQGRAFVDWTVGLPHVVVLEAGGVVGKR